MDAAFADDGTCMAVAARQRSRGQWAARCKSGYQFGGHTCNRFCKRGELLCSDCSTAEVVRTVRPDGVLARAVRSLRGLRVSSLSPAGVR